MNALPEASLPGQVTSTVPSRIGILLLVVAIFSCLMLLLCTIVMTTRMDKNIHNFGQFRHPVHENRVNLLQPAALEKGVN